MIVAREILFSVKTQKSRKFRKLKYFMKIKFVTGKERKKHTETNNIQFTHLD